MSGLASSLRSHWNLAVSFILGLSFLVSTPQLATSPRTFLLARILAAALIGSACWLLIWGVASGPQAIEQRTILQKKFLKEWFIQASFGLVLLGSWLGGQWPGFLNIDTFVIYRELKSLRLHEWASSLYSLYLLTLQQLSKNPGLVPAVQVVVAAVLSGFLFSLPVLDGRPVWIWRLLLFIFLINPLNGALNVTLSRDIIFSWCHMGCALFVPCYRLFYPDKANPSLLLIGAYSLAVVCTAKLRMETVPTLIVLPFLLAGICLWRRKAVAIFCAFTAFFGVLIFETMPSWTRTFSPALSYSATSFINPLSYLLHHSYKTDDREGDAQIIDRFLDFSLMAKMPDPYEITAFHKGLRKPVKKENYLALRNLFLKMIWRNPGLFIENRWVMFLALNGYGRHTFYFGNDLEARLPGSAELRSWFPSIKKAPWSEPLHALQLRLLRPFFRGEIVPFPTLFVTNTIAFLVLLLSLLLFPWAPATAGAALFVFLRLVIVFLTAPAPHFTYVYGVYLFGVFAPVLLWMELQKNGSNKLVGQSVP